MDLAARFRQSDTLVAVMRVEDGAFIDVNPAFERVLGYPRDEVIGKRSIEIGLWPDLQTRAMIWGRLRAQRSLASQTTVFRARDGTEYLGELSCELFSEAGVPCVFAWMQSMRAVGEPTPEARDLESYRALFHAAAEGIYRSLPGGGFVDANPAAARIFGYESPDQLMLSLKTATDLYVDPAQARHVHELLDRDGRIEDVRSQVRRRDGTTIWVSENCRVVRDEGGRVLFYEGTAIDITERLAAEHALRQSEALYKVLVDNCRDGVFLIQSGRVLFVNRALADMLGRTIESLVGTQYMDLVAPEDRHAQGERRAARESGSQATQHYEVNLLHRSGDRRLMLVHADAIEYEGAIASTGIVRDITEDRRQRIALEEAERKYRELFEQCPIGLVRTHLDGTILEVNPALAQMMGYGSPEALQRGTPRMHDVYADPAERERVLARVRADGVLRGMQIQVKRADGERLWVEISARMLQLPDGTAHFEASVIDVTQRLATEQALKRSEARYRNLVEHSQVGVYMMLGDHYTYVNAAFAAMVGYAESELIGLDYHELVTEETERLQRERQARRERGEAVSQEYECTLRRKDGAQVHVIVSAGYIELDGRRYTSGTLRDISRRRQAEQRLKFNATHDPLTGLPNRLLFQQQLGEAIKRARADQRYDYAVLFLDLDGFKLVNDSLGHAAGDRLLVAIAEKLSVAIAGEALVARYGGDEFTVLPIGTCTGDRALALADRVLGIFDRAFDIAGHHVYSGASVGVVLGRAEYRSPDQVLRDADTAMYRAKAAGKSAYVVFDEAMHAAARARFQLEIDLRLAFEREEFRTWYQPIVSLRDGRIVAVEALVRWQHPQRGLLLPADFLRVAEEAGLLAELDWWMLEEAGRQLAAWRRRYPHCAELRVNVNVD
ncbi:MAG TPA: PAS domain S-box protein, partial [Xanthomonadales bacterium]|nr:PAS domain S-box protein [Xanthomonadales bacterium]